MKRAICLLLIFTLCLTLTGCAEGDAAKWYGTMQSATRANSAQVTFEIEYETSDDLTVRLYGTGTVTDLLGDNMCLEAKYSTEYIRTQTLWTPSLSRDARSVKAPTHTYTTEENPHRTYYRDGSLYFAKGAYDRALDDLRYTLDPTRTISLTTALRNGLWGETVPPGTISNTSVSAGEADGKTLRCSIAPDSELGGVIFSVFAALGDGTIQRTNVAGIRAELSSNNDGQLEEMEITLEFSTFVTNYELTMIVGFDYEKQAAAIPLPDYMT